MVRTAGRTGTAPPATRPRGATTIPATTAPTLPDDDDEDDDEECKEKKGKGHDSHGEGHGYGHEDHCDE